MKQDYAMFNSIKYGIFSILLQTGYYNTTGWVNDVYTVFSILSLIAFTYYSMMVYKWD